VKLAKDSPFGDDRAELITILEPPIDTELQSILDKSRQTEVITHPVFGVLEFFMCLTMKKDFQIQA